MVMSDGKMHDVTAVKNYFDIEPDSIKRQISSREYLRIM